MKRLVVLILVLVSPVFSSTSGIVILEFANGNSIQVTEYRIIPSQNRVHFKSAGSGMRFTIPLDWIDSISKVS